MMLRKTAMMARAEELGLSEASMRPEHDAPENDSCARSSPGLHAASMRPEHDAPENERRRGMTRAKAIELQ